ncbi:hypothetical protein J3F84DRAFT_273082 [Trichoderma pleuroticola]
MKQYTLSKQAGKQAGKQVGKQAGKQASRQASKQASKQAKQSKQSKQSKQEIVGLLSGTSVGLPARVHASVRCPCYFLPASRLSAQQGPSRCTSPSAFPCAWLAALSDGADLVRHGGRVIKAPLLLDIVRSERTYILKAPLLLDAVMSERISPDNLPSFRNQSNTWQSLEACFSTPCKPCLLAASFRSASSSCAAKDPHTRPGCLPVLAMGRIPILPESRRGPPKLCFFFSKSRLGQVIGSQGRCQGSS